MIKKEGTFCCAMAFASMSADTTATEIAKFIAQMKEESEKEWSPSDRSGGQRAVEVVTTGDETELVWNLLKNGFHQTGHIKRRKGYPKGILTVWRLNW